MSFEGESFTPNEKSTDEKASLSRGEQQKNLKTPKKKGIRKLEVNRVPALSQVVESVSSSVGKTRIPPKDKINQDGLVTFENCNKSESAGREVPQNIGLYKSQVETSVLKSEWNKANRHEAEGLSILGKFNVAQWIETVCWYYKLLPTFVNLENIEIKGRVMVSPKMSDSGISAIKQLEKIVEAQNRKEQYLNMYALNRQFENLCINSEEVKIFKCLFQRCRSIREEYGTKLRTAYRAKEKLMSRFLSYCKMKGYSSPWFYSHFAHLPMVSYDVGRRDYQNRTKEQRKKETA